MTERLSVLERRNSLADLPPEIRGERVVSRREAAAIKGVSLDTWARMTKRGETPPAVKRGVKALGYRLKDLIGD